MVHDTMVTETGEAEIHLEIARKEKLCRMTVVVSSKQSVMVDGTVTTQIILNIKELGQLAKYLRECNNLLKNGSQQAN